ncbi:MAG: tetratricopeptide repeat protein, partial [Cyanobacteria bacterium P01_F01_bin.3]
TRIIEDRWEEGNPLGNLGNSFCSLGDYKRALKYHSQRLKIAEEIKDKLGESHALTNLGNAYQKVGLYDKAISYCDRGLKASRSIGDRRGEGNALQYLGNVYMCLHQNNSAFEKFNASLKIFREIQLLPNQIRSLKSLVEVSKRLRDSAREREFSDEMLEKSEKLKISLVKKL